MALLKIYDSNGLSVMFKSAHENLGIKGVQLESMGFLHLRHSFEWGAFESVSRSIITKY